MPDYLTATGNSVPAPFDPLVERFSLLGKIVQELARIAGVEPADSLYTTLERLREVQSQDTRAS